MTMPKLVRLLPFELAHWCKILKEESSGYCFDPVLGRHVGLLEEALRFLRGSAVGSLGHGVLLRSLWGC
jgi:hypothetical protein